MKKKSIVLNCEFETLFLSGRVEKVSYATAEGGIEGRGEMERKDKKGDGSKVTLWKSNLPCLLFLLFFGL